MRIPITLFLGLLIALPITAIELKRHPAADDLYEARRGRALSEEEALIVGKWEAENREVAWEIHRKGDGTYEIILKGEFDGEPYVDYHRGIWGIRNGSYYYAELETNYPDFEFSATPTYERVLESSGDHFLTVMPGSDGEALESEEFRVETFHFDFWKQVGASQDSDLRL